MADGEEKGGANPLNVPLQKDGENLPGALLGGVEQGYESFRHPLSKDGVFTGAKKVLTGKNLYETDKVEPTLKLLDPLNIKEAVALAGMDPGVHQHIIRGDSVYHFLKNRLHYVDGNEILDVKSEQHHQVEQAATFGYRNNRTVTVGIDDRWTVKGNQDTYILGKSTHQFIGTHEVTAPEEFEWKQLERGFSAMKLDMAGFGLDIHLAAADIHTVDAELIVAEARSATFSDVNKAMKAHLRILLLAAALELAIVGRLNGAPDYGVGTPLR